MLASVDIRNVSRRRSLRHPTRCTYRVPITRVRHNVPVSLQVAAAEPPPDAEIEQPEWLTDAWRDRVEAEAMHRLEDRLHGAD